ncbi:recombinase RecA [Murdochiella sp. Marseille-P8839]|nr:recombinase RecA [Murdochiella sp. Marseille-P8839]
MAIANMKQEDKEKALKMAFNKIEKQFGKGAIMKLGEQPVQEIDAIPTGAINLDLALGVGGLPRGRVVEIYGPESSGKTTLALETIAEAQKLGGIAAFIDAEHALDVGYARRLGVDTDNLVLSQPDDGESALEILESLVRSNAVDIVVLDSVAALVPRAEIEGEMGDTHVGLLARLMSQALRKLTPVVAKSNTTVVFLNQIRQKIGVMYGNPEVTTGGVALKFYSTIRLDIRRGEQIKDGEDVIGNRTRVKVVKNKVAPPFKRVEFDIMYGTGISKIGTLLDTALDLGIVERAGAWYSYDGERLGQGRENAKNFIAENLDLHKKLEKELRDTLREKAQREEESEGNASDTQSNAGKNAPQMGSETFTLD